MTDRIQALRTLRGWSQAQLAHRAGVSRQLVGAVESGRQVPNVTAALRLAAALDTTVEDLFAPSMGEITDIHGGQPVDGTPVAAARVGERVITAPLAHGADPAESWALADATVTDGELAWFDQSAPAALVIAGCDPILGLMTNLLGRTGHRALAVHASTGRAIEALAAGRAHGVMVHARADWLPKPPVGVRRWSVASWQVGLAGTAAAPSVVDIAERRPVVVQRDAGAGTQRAFQEALREVGASGEIPGPIASGHFDVARRVAYGGGEAGVVMEAAAIAYELGFSPLEAHSVELWIADEWADLPAAVALVDVLAGRALSQRAAHLAGYDLSTCGTELTA